MEFSPKPNNSETAIVLFPRMPKPFIFVVVLFFAAGFASAQPANPHREHPNNKRMPSDEAKDANNGWQQRRAAVREALVQRERMPADNELSPKARRQLSAQERQELRQQLRQQRSEASKL